MQKAMTIGRVSAAVAIACLVALVGAHGAAQEDKPVRAVYQATAMGQGTQLGKTFNVTITIGSFSTDEERQILMDSFKQAGSQGLFNALEKMPARGRIAVTGTLGYDISFVRKIPTDDGYKIRVLTNRPIRFREAWINGRSVNYNLSFFELNINDQMKNSTGILLPVCEFKIDKKTGEVVAENYQNPWKLQNIMDRSRE